MFPLLIALSLFLVCTSSATAQRVAGEVRVVFESHPRVGTPTTWRYATNDLPFNVLFFFGYDATRGPLPRRCLLDPLACWKRFIGPATWFGSFTSELSYGFRVPGDISPLPFFVVALDSSTLKFAPSPVETLVIDVPFRHVTIDAQNPADAACKTLGDIDGDGFTDALAASANHGQGVFWYEWKAGFKKHRLAAGDFAVDMQVADIDRDGDNDVVIPSLTTQRVMWYENPRPSGDPRRGLWKAHSIGMTALAHDVEVGDVDRDGDVDVVVREKQAANAATVLFLQQSPSSFKRIVVHTSRGEGTALGDIDGDGDLDLAHNGFWVEMPQDPAAGGFKIHTIDPSWPWDVGVTIADINADGKTDVLLAPAESANGRLMWYESASPKTGPWKGHLIDSGVSYAHTFKTGDIDNDGDLDVVIAEMHQSQKDRVAVYFNHGLGFTRQVVATTGSHNLRVADIGSDGDLDIFGANWNNNSPTKGRIEYWENLLDGYKRPKLPVDRWARRVIDARKPWQTVFVDAVDLNGDRKPDVVTGGHWYQNPGKASGNWVRRSFGGSLFNMAAVSDFDGDGDMDVLGTDGKVLGSAFSWARNDGSGGFTLFGNLPRGHGDFLQGVAVSQFARGGGSPCQIALSWHVTTKGVQMLDVPKDPASGTWRWHSINGVSQDEALSVGDIDRDGDSDLLLGTKWLRNNGSSWTAHTLNQTAGSPDRNRLADINGDGRLDAVVGFEAISSTERVAWYEQPTSPTGAWAEHVIARIVGPMSLDVADLDNDGDLDVVAGEHNLRDPQKARVLLFENVDRRGGLWRTHVVGTGDEHHDGTRLVDIDMDGDVDIVSIGWKNGRVLVYENLAIR